MVAVTGRTDSGALLPAREAVSRRVVLEPAGGSGDVLASVDGAPWLVHTGDLLLLGSRLDPDWTAIPLSASFVPFIDAIVTRASRGDTPMPDAMAGAPVAMLDRVSAVGHDGVVSPIAANAPWRPPGPGVFHLLAAADTIGAVSVHLDPRESNLSRATDGAIRSLWSGVAVAGLSDGPALAFATGGRGDLRGALLLLALGCALGETALVGRVRKRT
jgi:hypothetical protein